MLKERYQFVRNFLYAEELFLLTVNFFLLHFLTTHFHQFYRFDIFPDQKIVSEPYQINLYYRAFWLAILIWAFILRFRGEYSHLRVQAYRKVIVGQLFNGLLFFGIFAASAFFLKYDFLSRLFMILYTVSSVFCLLLNRLLVLYLAYYVRRKGYNIRNILLVGTGRRAQDFLSLVARHKEWGYKIIGLLDQDPAMTGQKVAGYKVLGVLDDLPKLLETRVVDEVVMVVPRSWLKEIEKCVFYCEAVGVPATLSTDFFDLEIASGVPKELDGFTYLTFETRRLKDPELLVKRTLDLILSVFFLVLLSPVFFLVAFFVKVSSDGPVFFRQVRSGMNGRVFNLFKFRSMIQGAEHRLEELKALNEMSGPVFKLENDPRLTKVGRFLRKTSLDEIPQFWNVLKGDMSIVGPRPPLPSEVDKYQPWQRRRLSMKPGITCIWQVSGRNKIDFDDWMRLDLHYIDRWSLWLGFKIILMTVRAVLTTRGAK